MSFSKRTLFVQPETELFYASDEAEKAVNILGANLLSGKVEIDDLIDRVRDFQPELIIISSHGTEDGILLSDGTISGEKLAPILGTSDVSCIYLNTCDSIRTALRIHASIPVDFLFNISEVPDRDAFIALAAFAHHLSEGNTYRKAWFKSRGGSGSELMFLPSMADFQEISIGDNMAHANNFHRPKLNGNGTLKDIDEEVTEIARIIYGDDRSRFPGLIDTVKAQEKSLAFIKLAVSILIFLMVMVIIGGIAILVLIL